MRLRPLLHLQPPHHQLLSLRLHRPQVWDPATRNGFLERCFITLLAFSFFPLSFPKVKQWKWKSEGCLLQKKQSKTSLVNGLQVSIKIQRNTLHVYFQGRLHFILQESHSSFVKEISFERNKGFHCLSAKLSWKNFTVQNTGVLPQLWGHLWLALLWMPKVATSTTALGTSPSPHRGWETWASPAGTSDRIGPLGLSNPSCPWKAAIDQRPSSSPCSCSSSWEGRRGGKLACCQGETRSDFVSALTGPFSYRCVLRQGSSLSWTEFFILSTQMAYIWECLGFFLWSPLPWYLLPPLRDLKELHWYIDDW